MVRIVCIHRYVKGAANWKRKTAGGGSWFESELRAGSVIRGCCNPASGDAVNTSPPGQQPLCLMQLRRVMLMERRQRWLRYLRSTARSKAQAAAEGARSAVLYGV
mgnify:CR=1 FL=1